MDRTGGIDISVSSGTVQRKTISQLQEKFKFACLPTGRQCNLQAKGPHPAGGEGSPRVPKGHPSGCRESSSFIFAKYKVLICTVVSSKNKPIQNSMVFCCVKNIIGIIIVMKLSNGFIG